MNSLRNLVGFILAFALAAFAAPSFAGNKTFDLTATSPVAVNQSISVTFTNRDDGNSSFNSVQLTGAPGASSTLEIVSASQTGSNKPGNYTISADKKSVTYTDLSPIKVNNPLTVTLVVKTTVPACGSGSIQWTGKAWTGSPSTPSNPFTTLDSPVTVVNSGACRAQFVAQPKKAIVGQRITDTDWKPDATEVQVKLLSGTAAVVGATVNLTSACSASGSLSLSNASAQTGSDGIAKFANLRSSNAGAVCKLTATRQDVPSVQEQSVSFDVVNAAAKFSPTPTSVAVEKPTTVTVKLVVFGSNPEQVIPQSGSGTLTVVSGTCTASSGTVFTTVGVLTFTVQGKDVGSTCEFKATGEFGGVTYGSEFTLTVPDVKVYTGVLACDDAFDALAIPAYNPLDPTTFNASPATADGTEDTAFLVGARSKGDPDKDDCSKNINFTVVNNINLPPGSDDTTDPLNNKVPAGGWSFTWDFTAVPNPVVGVITTYRSEWANSEGVSDKRVWICTATPCPGNRATYPLAWKKLEYCLSTLVTHSSIPVGEAACQARLVETVISALETSVYCTGTPPDPPANPPAGWLPRCIQPTVYSIIGKDPVFER